MNDSQKYIKNAIVLSSSAISSNNAPSQYGSRQKQYFSERTRAYTDNRSYLASDYVKAQVQGLLEDFYEYVETHIRLSDIVSPSASISKRVDDFKEVLIPDKSISYIPIGARIETMGNTWIVINPSNISSVTAKTVVGRCNASYNSYDAYGNIVTEPIMIEKAAMLGNDTEDWENIVLMDGYFNITCQLNKNTSRLSENSRIILGRKAYYITGVADFLQEFTGDRESNHLVTFTARVTEVTENDDISINYIANAKSMTFSAILSGQDNIKAGTSATFKPMFIVNGIEVIPTDEYPQDWEFTSSDESVATVDENGVVSALKDGNAVITAKLLQNTAISAESALVVAEGENEPYVEFVGFVEPYILQYTSATYDASYYEDGVESKDPLEWSFGGASENDYIATISADGRSVTIECVSASDEHLSITASKNGKSATVHVELSGY